MAAVNRFLCFCLRAFRFKSLKRDMSGFKLRTQNDQADFTDWMSFLPSNLI